MARSRPVLRYRRLAAAALTLALAGCKTVGPNFQPPAPPATPSYQMQGDRDTPVAQLVADPTPAGAWWQAFGSPKLDQVMDQALAGNRTIAEADATLERARQQALSAHGAQLPQAAYSVGPLGERINTAALGFSGFPSPTVFLYQVGGTVTYDADLFGGLRRGTEAASARADAEARRADAARLTLTGQAALTAVQIATLRAQIAAVDAAVADDQRLINLTRRAEEAGGQPRSAVNALMAQQAADQTLLPPLQQQLAQARHMLALLVGRAPADWAAPDFDLADFRSPPTVPVSLPSTLVRRRPDILVAQSDLHAATAEIGVATAALYPDIKISANITQTAIAPGQLFSYGASGWSLGAALTGPIFNGGRLKANQRAAQAEARAAAARYEQTVLTAFGQVSDVMQAIANDDAALQALARTEAAQRQTLTDAETLFRLGGGPLFPVIDAERQLSMTRRNRAMTEGKRLADIAQLFVATAADWRTTPAAQATSP